jgi:hypothetical protein
VGCLEVGEGGVEVGWAVEVREFEAVRWYTIKYLCFSIINFDISPVLTWHLRSAPY